MGCGRRIGPFDCCSVVCGDCLELMKALPTSYNSSALANVTGYVSGSIGLVDAVVTDPPYGTGWVRGGGAVGVFHPRHEQPEWDVFSVDWIRPEMAGTWAVFCPKNRAEELARVFPDAGLAYYRKTNPRPNGIPVEAIVVSPRPWGWDALECAAYNGDCPEHPCQKPLEVMEWLVSEIDGETILDPFAGSGTTLVAAKKLGRHFLGFEISEYYCCIARERIALVEAQPNLFEPKPEQLRLE